MSVERLEKLAKIDSIGVLHAKQRELLINAAAVIRAAEKVECYDHACGIEGFPLCRICGGLAEALAAFNQGEGE